MVSRRRETMPTALPSAASIPGGQGPQGATEVPVVRPEPQVEPAAVHGPAVAQPGHGALSLVRPRAKRTASSSLVALAGAASSADIACFASLVASSSVALSFFFFFLAFCLASAVSAAACLAAFLTAILAVVLEATAAASAADFVVVFIKSFGIRNVPNLLCRAKTWWSCVRRVSGIRAGS